MVDKINFQIENSFQIETGPLSNCGCQRHIRVFPFPVQEKEMQLAIGKSLQLLMLWKTQQWR